VAGLLAAGLLVWQGSTAAFSATTANTGNAWATGNMVLTNNGGVGTTYSGTTTALISASNLVASPGVPSTGTKCITVDSSGSLPGALKLYRSSLSDTTQVGQPASTLSGKVNLVITSAVLTAGQTVDASCVASSGIVAFPAGSAVYTGTLAGMPGNYAAAGAPVTIAGTAAERVAYRIVWTIDTTVNNTYQSASTSANLTWEIQ
jgi:hypothetical protein